MRNGVESMKKSNSEKKKVTNVAKALADVPIDNRQERDDLRVRLRQTYSELESIKMGHEARGPCSLRRAGRAPRPVGAVGEPPASEAVRNSRSKLNWNSLKKFAQKGHQRSLNPLETSAKAAAVKTRMRLLTWRGLPLFTGQVGIEARPAWRA